MSATNGMKAYLTAAIAHIQMRMIRMTTHILSMRAENGRRKIYMASSWKMHKSVRTIAQSLRDDGHEVFDFSDPTNRPEGLGHFVFDASDWSGKPLGKVDWLEFLGYDATHTAFKSDKAGLDWADTVVMVLPCGRSAHMEAGYAVGKGKEVYIIGELPKGEFDVMHLFANGHYRTEQINCLMDRLLLNTPDLKGRKAGSEGEMAGPPGRTIRRNVD